MAVHVAPTATPSRVPKVRVARPARRLGYTIVALVNGVLLYLINVVPGWEALSFLTDDVTLVLGLLNASLVVGIVVNVVWVLADPPWLRSIGQLVVSAVSLGVILAVLDVFPFDYSEWSFDATLLTRVVLVIAAVGTVIGLLVEAVGLVRWAVGREET